MGRAEEIKEALEDILNQVAKIQNIKKFEIHANMEANFGDGFSAQFFTGDIYNKDTGKTTAVAIKKAPNYDFDYNTVFRNEYLFYNMVLPAIKKLQIEIGISDYLNNFPKYFCSGLEPKKEYIAMENLKISGYIMFDKKQYWEKDLLKKLFVIYGKFHALSYVLRIKDEEKYKKIGSEFVDICNTMAEFMGKPMVTAISAAVNALHSENDKIIKEELKDFGENAIETFLESCVYNGEHRCLIHGDCWSNNMLFKYSESGELLDIKLIDFQLTQDNSPIHDLSYFFYSGASKTDLDNLDNYLEIYHKTFTMFAKELGADIDEIFSFATLKKEWKENALYGVIMGIYLWQVKLIPKEKFAILIDPNPDIKTSLEEGNKLWETLMSSLHSTDEFKEKTTPILRHAFEYGVINKDRIVRNK